MGEMITVYVLLRIKPGMDRNVLSSIKKLTQVKIVETLYGEYDMLIKVRVETLQALDSFIFDTIRTIKGVDGSTTLIVMEVPGAKSAMRRKDS
ncbi:MAG: Lrp/AsnC ligand binding domain-containing protein [Candidatus Bathyarchaeota archaeon]|nr:Lrp/AsnC ligand binding domain-containing protein [Candidatus Bathyarchaeota archaeon]MDH5746515.1 Lrp/AsnC ligand binding domain-containing protein [Candidatus Bathyarchaeota archaeon]